MGMAISEFEVKVGNRSVSCLLAEPEQGVTADPALLLSAGMTRQQAMSIRPCSLTAEAFVAAGHRVVGFDMPHHGERVGHYEPVSLAGMCDAVLAGEDPFDMFVEDGIATLDACLARKLSRLGRICAVGVSRTGYCVFRLAAADSRISAVSGLAPVTDWRSLIEFAPHRDDPRIAALDLENYLEPLSNRPLFAAIGSDDERVGTDRCVKFMSSVLDLQYRRNRSGGKKIFSSLHVDYASEGHAIREMWYEHSTKFLLHAISTT